MKTVKILVAEDDANLRQGLIDLLEAEGYQVFAAEDGAAALKVFADNRPDLALLDIMMPEKSGYEVCREIRREDGRMPIIMLTAKGEEIDKVVGLELGADDYVTKPFGVHELRARIAAVLRRAAPVAIPEPPKVFRIGSAEIDRGSYHLHRDGLRFPLTAKEMKLLEVFFLHPGQVLSRNELLNLAWGIGYFGTTRTLDQHIAQLRKKIEPDPASPRVIITLHGVGYRYEPLTGVSGEGPTAPSGHS